MKIRNPVAHWLIARLATWILKLLFLTVRADHRSLQHYATPYRRRDRGQRYCFCLWHDAIVTALFSLKTADMAALISRHQDGSYLTHAIKLLGITPVRGSASRGGAQATRQLIDRPDLHVCITPDGPRGPRRTMKEGIVFLSSRTSRPVVPTTVVATRSWSIPGGWSDMLLPKPFSRVLLLAGSPVEVANDASREEMTRVAARIQDEMDRLDEIGRKIIAGDETAWDELQQNPTGASPDADSAAAAA